MPAAHRSCAFAAAAVLHIYAIAASAPATLAPPPLLPRRIVDNLANAPLAVECRVRRGPLRNVMFKGVLVLQEDGGCEVVLEDGNAVNGTWTMLPAGHEILDRLWDEVRFDAVLADGVPYVAHARLYARWPHGHSLTTHGAVLRGRRGWLRPVVASFELSHACGGCFPDWERYYGHVIAPDNRVCAWVQIDLIDVVPKKKGDGEGDSAPSADS